MYTVIVLILANAYHVHANEVFIYLSIFRVNRLSSLPRGLGTASGLEILDLTYNNLQKGSLPGNFSVMSKQEPHPYEVLIIVLYQY